MKLSRWFLLLVLPLAALADENAVNPQVQKIVDDVSQQRIHDIIAKLVSFGTRNTMSAQDDPNHGVGAAREWIFHELQSYSPRLHVRFDKWHVKKKAPRIFKDVDLYNVVAVLPGKTMPDVEVAVTGHYDSLNLGTPPDRGNAAKTGEAVGERPLEANWEKNVDLPAPGASDDASGTAAVMELARVMSQYEFDKTLVFIAFCGEEQGLVGSTLEAAKAKKDGTIIEAVLNNDIIGNEVAGDGRTGNNRLSVFSDETLDSPSQQLARYIHTIGERYLPFMKVDAMYMQDRLGRGGDHSPFQQEGFAAVRFSTPNEFLAHEHHEADTLENMSVPYTARVAQVNAAVAATLALSPRMPDILTVPKTPPPATDGTSSTAAPAAPRRKLPMIGRGSGYDAVLKWHPAAANDANLKGYAIVMRSTTSPYWEQEIFVGKVTEYTLKGISIDEERFGVKAIGNDGTESLVAAYAYPDRAKVSYDAEPFN
jgi:hypothetical protein